MFEKGEKTQAQKTGRLFQFQTASSAQSFLRASHIENNLLTAK